MRFEERYCAVPRRDRGERGGGDVDSIPDISEIAKSANMVCGDSALEKRTIPLPNGEYYMNLYLALRCRKRDKVVGPVVY